MGFAVKSTRGKLTELLHASINTINTSIFCPVKKKGFFSDTTEVSIF